MMKTKPTQIIQSSFWGLFLGLITLTSTNTFGQWQQINNGLTGKGLEVYTSLVVNAGILIGTEGGGIYFSSDGGNSWVAKNTGLSTAAAKTISDMILTKDSTIFVSTTAGVYKLSLIHI